MLATESSPPEGTCGGGLIEQIIRRYVEDDNVVFVFPTEIAASMWQERALGFHPQGVLPDERFLPWDRFRGIHAAKAEAGKAEIHERARQLYAERLAERNAAAARKGKPLLSAAIPAEFAASASSFAPWIASLLPHLALFEEKSSRAGGADAESQDISFIHEDYKAFLERSKLFEPGWCRRFEGGGKKHIIFFYEAIQGFSACAAALGPAYFSGKADVLPCAGGLADFTAVSAPGFSGEEASFSLFDDFMEEFRRVALKIQALLQDGEACGDIAVSLADAEAGAPYLARELAARGIPFRLRFGRVLAESGAGRIFPLIQQCNADGFSFSSVKKLLSLKSVAWRSPGMAAGLVRFGIRNRCLCSWRENGELADIWKTAFGLAEGGAPDSLREWYESLEDWYKKLARNVRALCSAKTFADVRARWFAFRDSMLDGEKMGFAGGEGRARESLDIGRCIAELDALVDLERACPELTPRDPFSFFVSRLKKARFVPQGGEEGVSVFKYKDAAAAPFKFHFVTGATQEDATALHSELKFLRKDKRAAIGALDEDASLAMFSSYINGAGNGGLVAFSAPLRGVGANAYKTPHGAFGDRSAKGGGEEGVDGFLKESALPQDPIALEERQERPSRIYPAQKAGLEAYTALNGDKAARFSFLKEGFEGSGGESLLRIRKRLAKSQKDGGRVTHVSPTDDLNPFAECPAKWLLKRALRLREREFSPELDIANAAEKGNIFHKAAQDLYELIGKRDGAFRAGNAAAYLEEARKIVPAAVEAELSPAVLEGPLGELSRPALEATLMEWVEALVRADSGFLDGYVPAMTESKVCVGEDGIEYEGRIDRISEMDCGSGGGVSTVIVDYKTGTCPGAKDCRPDGSGKIRDFQMPFYVFLCREKLGKDATKAWFFSAPKKAYVRILDDASDPLIKASTGNGFKSRKEFEDAIDAMKKEARAFADAIGSADFSAKGVYPSDCQSCDFKAVCRHGYAVARD